MPAIRPETIANKAREDRNADIVYAIAAGFLGLVVAILMMYNLLKDNGDVGLAVFLFIFVIAFGTTAARFCLKVIHENAEMRR